MWNPIDWLDGQHWTVRHLRALGRGLILTGAVLLFLFFASAWLTPPLYLLYLMVLDPWMALNPFIWLILLMLTLMAAIFLFVIAGKT